jgi:hypothetical protein
MKKSLILILFFVITILNCYSQNDWKSGYVIKLSGDTVFGLIDNRDSKSQSNYCYFRKDKLSESIIYAPKDISGFRFNDGKFFISKEIPYEDSTRKIFLEFLVEGKVNVFHYQDELSHFFLEKDGQIYELKNTTVIKYIHDVKYFIDTKEYIQLLNLLMKDADMKQQIDHSILESKSLIKLAKNYHDRVCTGEKCIIYEKKIKPARVNFGIHVGESINKFNFGDNLFTDYSFSNYVGCRVELNNIANYVENLSLQVDLTLQNFSTYNLKSTDDYYSTISYNGKIYSIYNGLFDDNTKELNVDLKAVVLKLPVVITYTFSQGNIRPFLGLGISNTFVIAQNKDFVYSTFSHEYQKSIPTYSLGFIGRIGCKYVLKNNHAFYSDLDIDYSQNLTRSQFLRLQNNLYSLTIGYTL